MVSWRGLGVGVVLRSLGWGSLIVMVVTRVLLMAGVMCCTWRSVGLAW